MYSRLLITAAMLLAISFHASHAQYVPQFDETLYLTVGDKTTWDLTFLFKHEKYPALTADETFARVDADAKEYEDATFKKYRSQVRELYSYLGTNGAGSVAFIKGTNPADFVKYKGKLCLRITALATPETFDVNDVTLEQRATRVLESKILPLLGSFNAAFEKSQDLKHFAIQVTYGSHDPSSELDPTKGESVMMVVSKNDCKAYIDKKITAAEIVKRSEVLVSDRAQLTEYKKITVQL